MRGAQTLSLAAAAAVLVGGCGTDRQKVVTTTPRLSHATRAFDVPRVGLKVTLPRQLAVSLDVRAPGAFKATFGEPFVSAFAYQRSEQLPRTTAELADAGRRLSRAVQARRSGYRLLHADATEVDGAPTVELLGRQTISRRSLQIRSLHVFKGRAEYVIEVVAPDGQFKRFDSDVTPLIRRTLDVSGAVTR